MFQDIWKMTYTQYVEKLDVLSDEEKDLINVWSSRNFFSQMMDIWGEVDKLPTLYEKSLLDKDSSALKMQLQRVSKFCKIVRNCPGCTKGEREEIKIAEWELYDFYLGNNLFNNENGYEASKWFEQWCYNINYELLTA